MIKFNQNDHNVFVKPLIGKIEATLPNMSSSELIIVEPYFIQILKFEFEYDNLLSTLQNITPLKTQISKKYELYDDILNVTHILNSQEQQK